MPKPCKKMTKILKYPIWLSSYFLIAPLYIASAQEVPKVISKQQEVIINGKQSDIEAQRDFVAGKILIGRKKIDESGVSTVAELLKQHPAITIGRNGNLGLQGLPGYTQILVDGEASLGGKGPLDLELIRVDKIEIIKSSVAEFGPFGIAGTINVITRKLDKKSNQQLTIGAATQAGRPSANVAWSINQNDATSALNFNAHAGAAYQASATESELLQTIRSLNKGLLVDYTGQTSAYNKVSSWDIGATVDWKPNNQHRFRFSPSYSPMYFDSGSKEQKYYSDRSSSNAMQIMRGPFTWFQFPVEWLYALDDDGKLELKTHSNRIHNESNTQRTEIFSDLRPVFRRNSSDNKTISDTLKLNYTQNLANSHDVKSGIDILRSNQRSDFRYEINGAPDSSLDDLGRARDIKQRKYGAFVQDDWRLSDELAFNLGLSFSERTININEGNFRTHAKYNLFSPSAHLAKKIDGDDKQQVRFSIAQSFKAPDVSQLSLRPTIHPLALCTVNGLCGPNAAETADRAGNPNLQAERSLGANLSYEHGIGADSQISIEFFVREIDRLIGTDIKQENVSWATTQRFVARPTNFGRANVFGVDMEAQLSLRNIWQTAPRVELRGNINLGYSKINSFPGPDNRLSSQLPWQTKLGVTYDAKEWPLRLSADANWTPSDWVRSNLTQRVFYTRKFDFAMSASWKFTKDVRLSANLDNLFDRTTGRVDEYLVNQELVSLQENKTTFRKVSLRLEIKL